MSDVIDKGIARLANQFKKSTKFQEFLEVFLQQHQDLKASDLQLLNERYLDTAIGIQLDGIGKIVGLKRSNGLSDDSYRLLIRAKIIKNKTAMTVDDTLRLISFTFDGAVVRYFQSPFLEPRYDIIKILTSSEENLLSNLPVLIGIDSVEYHTYVDGTFSFFGDPDPTGLGFGDITNANLGGNFAKIVGV